MSYEIIEKNEYGVLVKNTKDTRDCEICKYTHKDVDSCLKFCKGGGGKYYLPDKEAAKLETENLSICSVQPMPTDMGISSTEYTGDYNQQYSDCIYNSDSQKELLDLQNENKQLKERVKELENNTTELIPRSGDITHDYWYYCQECLHNFEIDEEFNFCPNCGRKIIRN